MKVRKEWDMGLFDNVKRAATEKALDLVNDSGFLTEVERTPKFSESSSYGPLSIDSTHRLVKLRGVVMPKKSAAKTAAKVSAAVMTAGLSLIATTQMDKPKDLVLSVDDISYIEQLVNKTEITSTSSSSSSFGYRPGYRGGLAGGSRNKNSVKRKDVVVSYLALCFNTENVDRPQIVLPFSKQGCAATQDNINDFISASKALGLLGIEVQ